MEDLRHEVNVQGIGATISPIAPESAPVELAYKEWRESDERKAAKKISNVAFVLSASGLVAGTIIAASSVDRSAVGSYAIHAVPLALGIFIVLISITSVLFFRFRYNYRKSNFLDDWRREKIYDAIRALEPEDVKQLILLNQRRMDQYHQMTLTQAAIAWRSSQMAMTAGMFVLVASAAVAIGASLDTTSKVVIGSLGAIGSALSGYVAATFLRARSQSLAQLNYYFRQPLATSYLLTAERLAHKIPENDPMILEVWRTLITQIAGHAFISAPNPIGGSTVAPE
jgi:hypothetical protein